MRAVQLILRLLYALALCLVGAAYSVEAPFRLPFNLFTPVAYRTTGYAAIKVCMQKNE